MLDLILATAAKTAGIVLGVVLAFVMIGVVSLGAEMVKRVFKKGLRERVGR